MLRHRQGLLRGLSSRGGASWGGDTSRELGEHEHISQVKMLLLSIVAELSVGLLQCDGGHSQAKEEREEATQI